MASGTQFLLTNDSELYSRAHNNERKSHRFSLKFKVFKVPSVAQTCSIVPQQVSSTKENHLKRFNKTLHTDALVTISSSLRHLGIQRTVSLRIPKQSCRSIETLPCEMPNACAISLT